MRSYETRNEALKDFAAFAGYYLVVKYGYHTEWTHYGSRRHGRWYGHTSYDTTEDADLEQYELFQVGKKGGLKRLHLVSKDLPENTTFTRGIAPNGVTACLLDEDGKFFIDERILDALIEEKPEAEWEDGPDKVCNMHY